MDEAVFHSRRRMFVVRNGQLILAPAGLAMWHRDWFEEEGWNVVEVIATELRGFYLDGEVYFYRGEDFSFRESDQALVQSMLPALQQALDLAGEVKIFLGPQHKQNEFLGKLSELI